MEGSYDDSYSQFCLDNKLSFVIPLYTLLIWIALKKKTFWVWLIITITHFTRYSRSPIHLFFSVSNFDQVTIILIHYYYLDEKKIKKPFSEILPPLAYFTRTSYPHPLPPSPWVKSCLISICSYKNRKSAQCCNCT